jgi:hypothetical protein
MEQENLRELERNLENIERQQQELAEIMNQLN